MVRRFIDCDSSDFEKMSSRDIINSIRLSEGRVILSEVIGAIQPALFDVSNAELACSFGADILLLNMFDVFNPTFNGMDFTNKDIIKEIKRLTGRLIGINLEPIDVDEEEYKNKIENKSNPYKLTRGRLASVETAKKAMELGVDIIVLTGNPENYVSNKGILKNIREIRNALGNDIIIAAGKMHASGLSSEAGSDIINKDTVKEFISAGCDIILFPAPATVPGITVEYIKELVDFSHKNGALTITTIGTSQEGADENTIRSIALMCKMTGTDIHHLGDSGFPGIAAPENIMAYSIAIKGKRHTYRRMAKSVNR
jgi:hypothetical protein